MGLAKKIFVAGILAALLVWQTGMTTEYVCHEEIYQVKSRDTLWTIAEKFFGKQDKYRHFGEFVYSIRERNKVGKYIYPDQMIVIPLSVEKQN